MNTPLPSLPRRDFFKASAASLAAVVTVGPSSFSSVLRAAELPAARKSIGIQVGGRDFYLDLLFFHRALQCRVACDLKVKPFEPEHPGKMEFYLEALGRDFRKSHERPSIGAMLCASKDHEVVEYALARSVSPALIAEYQNALPDKPLLRRKLHEFYHLALPAQDPNPRRKE